mmetsp:Transcript_11465/g.7967  ORF Transcript_11465/g.7967 Transcript_11465/m.7967 type:complete len:191 (-) Transcript_11465:89-661(-)
MLINNAGIVSGKGILENSNEMMMKTFEVNTISHLHTIREFLPAMLANKKGHIVSIASMAGIVASPALADYSASKFGAIAIDESLRTELLRNGQTYVKTTCICPFFINTGMFKGAKRNLIFNILDQHAVVNRIMNAIRQDEQFVVIPYAGFLLYIARMLPPALADRVAWLIGGFASMDDFKGRQNESALLA